MTGLPDTGSNERTWDMLLMLITTSSLRGTLPPTRPVFPPWGTTAMRLSQQCLRMLLTSSVVFGLRTVVERPLYFPIQSLLYDSRSDWDAETGASVESTPDGDERMLEKCATSSCVTDVYCVAAA